MNLKNGLCDFIRLSTHHCFQSEEVNQIASFGFQSYSIGSRTVHLKWIKTNHTQIRLVRPSGTDSVYSYCSSHPGTYGINGTFYCTSSGIPSGYSVGDIHRISLYNANLGSSPATSVRPFGEVNVDNTFFYVLSASANYVHPLYHRFRSISREYFSLSFSRATRFGVDKSSMGCWRIWSLFG